jgi:hypothetical protein
LANWTFQTRIAILVVWCAEKSTSLHHRARRGHVGPPATARAPATLHRTDRRRSRHPVVLEHPLDELVVAVSQSVGNRQTAANAVTAWVFPGYRPGSHLNANHVRIRLKKLGFPSRSTRIGTRRTITQTTPPPVLADALGLNPQTAIRHARRGSGQYGAYVADRNWPRGRDRV